jgi:16S rRNA C1402 N4-methylase RsmH
MPAHIPVLLDEVIRFLDPKPGGRFIDATLGAGGHTHAILERSAPDGKVLAIDQDESALSSAKATLESFGSRIVFEHSSSCRASHSRSEWIYSVRRRARRHRYLIDDGGRSISRVLVYA